MNFTLSVLDLVPITADSTASQALAQMVEFAQLAEGAGYSRFWLAEHHGMPNIVSSSPEILIARVARETERIRVGAGGIMLPNHAPASHRGSVSHFGSYVSRAHRSWHRPSAGARIWGRRLNWDLSTWPSFPHSCKS